jgi:hypothetical protein
MVAILHVQPLKIAIQRVALAAVCSISKENRCTESLTRFLSPTHVATNGFQFFVSFYSIPVLNSYTPSSVCWVRFAFRIAGVLDVVHRPVLYSLETITFRKLDMIPSSGKGTEKRTLSSFIKRSGHWG